MELELNALKAQTTALQRDVDALRRQRRVGVGLLMTVIIGLGATSAITQTKPQDLVCNSLKVVSSDGKERIHLRSDENGGVVDVFGNDGKLRIQLDAMSGKRGGRIRAYGNNGKPGVIMGVVEDEVQRGGVIVVLDSDGVGKAFMMATHIGGEMAVGGNDGKNRAVIGVHEDRGMMSIVGNDGKARIHLRSNENGGAVDVFGNEGNPRIQVDTAPGKRGGRIQVYGNNGKPGIAMGVAEDEVARGGIIVVLGSDGIAKASVAVSAAGGEMAVSGSDGRRRAGMGVHEDRGTMGVCGNDAVVRAGMVAAPNGGVVEVYSNDSRVIGRLP